MRRWVFHEIAGCCFTLAGVVLVSVAFAAELPPAPSNLEAVQLRAQLGQALYAQSHAEMLAGAYAEQRDWWIACAKEPACVAWVFPPAPEQK
jgi:hypothetical protein